MDINEQNFDQVVFNKHYKLGNSLREKVFEGCKFKECDLSDADLSFCKFVGCELLECNLNNVAIGNCSFNGVKFSKCKFVGVDFSNINALILNFEFSECSMNLCTFLTWRCRERLFLDAR